MRYIGSSTNLRTRLIAHLKDLKRGAHANKLLQMHWNEYGAKSFSVHVLELVESTQEALVSAELKHWRSFAKLSLYNLRKPRPSPRQGAHHSEATKSKLRAASIGQHATLRELCANDSEFSDRLHQKRSQASFRTWKRRRHVQR